MVVWETYGISDVGKVRLRNEDAYAILDCVIQKDALQASGRLQTSDRV